MCAVWRSSAQGPAWSSLRSSCKLWPCMEFQTVGPLPLARLCDLYTGSNRAMSTSARWNNPMNNPRLGCTPHAALVFLTHLPTYALATAVPAAHSAATATCVCTGVFVSRAVYAHPQVRRRSERPPRSGSTLVPPPHARARAPEPPYPSCTPRHLLPPGRSPLRSALRPLGLMCAPPRLCPLLPPGRPPRSHSAVLPARAPPVRALVNLPPDCTLELHPSHTQRPSSAAPCSRRPSHHRWCSTFTQHAGTWRPLPPARAPPRSGVSQGAPARGRSSCARGPLSAG